MSNAPAFARQPLFVNEQECSRLLGIAESSWPAIRRQWEKRGFPRPNPDVKKYLWPAVLAWVFRDNGFDGNLSAAQMDGPEDFS